MSGTSSIVVEAPAGLFQIMPKSGGDSRPVGRPGGFLFSDSEIYFKEGWANTFPLGTRIPQ